MKNKVCVVTAARSEYGLLRWVIDALKNDKDLSLQLIVTGTHLSPEFGNTYKEIEADGYIIDAKVDMILPLIDKISIAKSMGKCSVNIADAFESLNPDLIVVLGDRYELLPICNAALVMRIPIAHISGGDITEGAIDDQIRNSVTMMSSLHFPGVLSSAKRIEQMLGNSECVFAVGEPGLENFKRLVLWNRERLSENLNIDISNNWILVTYHPETKKSLEYNMSVARAIVDSLMNIEAINVIITQANADFGGAQINEFFQDICRKYPLKFNIYPSLGQLRYLSFMKEVSCVIGNSSSGIVEAPYYAIPVVNIGSRQKGRFYCNNVLDTEANAVSIKKTIKEALTNSKRRVADYYYGDGDTSSKIIINIKNYLNQKKNE